MLCLRPRSVILISGKSFILGAKDIHFTIPRIIICESYIVLAPSEAEIRRWSPYIGVDLLSESLRLWSLALFAYNFARHFGVLTRIAQRRERVVNQLYSNNRVGTEKRTNGIKRDMPQFPMEHLNVDTFVCC